MISVRGRCWAAVGILALLALAPTAWADQPTGLSPAKESKADLACATVALDQGQSYLLQAPVVIHCAPPPVSHEGFRLIKWFLHSDDPAPEPASRSLVVAVHEMACAGGRNPIPYLQRPEVSYLKGAVVITLWIEELQGLHTCPANPVGHLRVRLPGPLGARQLYDGSSDPPRKVEPGEDPRRFPRR